MSLRYLSVCSGIEAATVAWHPLGMTPVAFSEIDAFPSALLAHHYPSVPNYGDMTQFKEWPDATVDVLVGGTPCQSFSVAGLRKGLDDPRGNLALVYLALADRYRPQWVVWENVPGVLSVDGGRAFGAFLGGLAELGYGWAYRVLDAQYCGVPQRRRRVFVVGHLGGRGAGAVLFERHSLSGHPPPRREARQASACDVRNGVSGSIGAHPTGGWGVTDIDTAGAYIPEVAQPLETTCHDYSRADGFNAVAFDWQSGGDSQGLDPKHTAQLQSCQVPAVAFSVKDHGADAGPIAPTLRAGGHSGSHANGGVMPAVAYSIAPGACSTPEGQADIFVRQVDTSRTLDCTAADPTRKQGGIAISTGMAVRRLTPRECERLQGFPDDYTLVPYRRKQSADGPRYKALGNSMAVPVMRWIGERLLMVNAIVTEATA